MVTTIAISKLDARAIEGQLPGFCALLIDAVEDGASIGFEASFNRADAEKWWRDWAIEVETELRLIWIAEGAGEIVGTVHLGFSSKPTAWNRAEVQKLLVHRSSRRKGIAKQLMAEVEVECRLIGRNLIYLDTETNSAAEFLYQKLGYLRLGDIPDYAGSPRGVLTPTTIYYKLLGERPR